MSTALPEVQPVENFQDVCIEPIKRIFTGDDIAAWLQSEALARLSTVMIRLNCAIRGKRIGQGDAHQSEVSFACQCGLRILMLLPFAR